MNNENDKCSVVFIKQMDGWLPVDLTEHTESNSPTHLSALIKTLRAASAVAKDFGLYCVFMLDMDTGEIWLEDLTTGEQTEEPTEIPATVSSAVLIWVSTLIGSNNVKMLQGTYEVLNTPVEDGNVYVKYVNSKDSEAMADECTCVYAYAKDSRFVGSYSTVDGCFIDKHGEKVEINGENKKLAEACFRISGRDKEEDKV